MDYRVQLDTFSGPLDLLLFFVRRDEIDIMDIPIARITREYLSYLRAMETLNVAIAGEFLVMAATLMRIKARMLLPRPGQGDEEEVEDPRKELAFQLLEYQRYREGADELARRMEGRRAVFPRPPLATGDEMKGDPLFYLGDVSLFDLVQVFKEMLDRLPPSVTYDVTRDQVTVREQMAVLMSKFADRQFFRFSELIPQVDSRQKLIVAFVALLELIRDGQVKVRQKGVFDDFVVERTSPAGGEMAEA
ncbi:MAG: segregation and condensation protein A [Fidelibacterota bacterium]